MKSVQFKRKISLVFIGLAIMGSYYLMYYKGRTDEIVELMNLAHEHGSIALDFKLKGGVHGLIITES